MSIYLRTRVTDSLPIDVRAVRPNLFEESSLERLSRQKILHGNREVECGELFDIFRSGDVADIVWQGNLSSVHQIGYQMKHVVMRIEGNAGRHVGSQMTSGEIIVDGDAGDYLGLQMFGGIIRVTGNAGESVGGRYPGSKSGMNRGTILVDGDAGNGVGVGMRRGLIAVAGNVGSGTGWNLLAGTIVVFGSCQASVGQNLKRGTIILAGEQTTFRRHRCPANFRYAGTYQPAVLPLISRWLKTLEFSFPDRLLGPRLFNQFAGDLLKGERGEVMCGI